MVNSVSRDYFALNAPRSDLNTSFVIAVSLAIVSPEFNPTSVILCLSLKTMECFTVKNAFSSNLKPRVSKMRPPSSNALRFGCYQLKTKTSCLLATVPTTLVCVRSLDWILSARVFSAGSEAPGRSRTGHRVLTDRALSKQYTNKIKNARSCQQSVMILREMETKRIEIGVFHFTAAIAVCGRNREVDRALKLLKEMTVRGIEPNVISYNATISACEKGSQWEKALGLLQEMTNSGIEPDVISYNAAISACEKGNQWRRLWISCKK